MAKTLEDKGRYGISYERFWHCETDWPARRAKQIKESGVLEDAVKLLFDGKTKDEKPVPAYGVPMPPKPEPVPAYGVPMPPKKKKKKDK